MDTRSLKAIASEMEAHERECVVYREMTKSAIKSLEYRIKRLELLIWGSSATIIGVMVTVILSLIQWKI
ncbi:MAG: hypothetical protein CML86_07410 [Rhodobiaceae bacterium]|jgi:hypothetical protein|nr:hypothetical protein [Rhodobiaceae bacterium]|tara:strand:- start:2548 stop:2754 length:207 start_codon:yes stop_codon:yes gene_type:complete